MISSLSRPSRSAKIQTWVYPWDVLEGGVDKVLGELRDLGLDGLELTTNYHPIGTLSPRGSGKRVLYTELGAVFFPARPERYGRVKPELWPDREVLRVWPQVAERAERLGLRLNAWSIGMFQPWLTRQCPDCAKVLPTGDRIPATACPGNRDVQEFFAAMCADVASQFPVELIELEGIAFHKYQYGWVRPRILVEVSPWTEWLLSLCFCESCCARARQRGVGVEGLRRRVTTEIERCFEADGDADPARPLEKMQAEWLELDLDLCEFVACRENAVVELLIGISDAVKQVSDRCRIGVWGPIEVDGSVGVNLSRVLDHIGAVLIWHPEARREEAARIRLLTETAQTRVQLTHFQACGWPYGVDSQQFRQELEVAIEIGADQISFYNYGLVRRGQLARFAALARSLLDARRG